MRAALALIAFALGCDDPTVRAKITSVLDHGIVAAQARCSCSLSNSASEVENGMTITAQKLIDGSCLITEASAMLPKLCSRSDACAADCSGNGASLADGEFSHVVTGHATFSAPISTCCTGFNLEAFGVE